MVTGEIYFERRSDSERLGETDSTRKQTNANQRNASNDQYDLWFNCQYYYCILVSYYQYLATIVRHKNSTVEAK